MPKTALLTGLTGQDGSYLAELLLSKNYRVLGHVRPDGGELSSRRDLGASAHLLGSIEVFCFPETSEASWASLLEASQPDEIYHLGASSSVPESWQAPSSAIQTNFNWTALLLEQIRRLSPKSKLFFACSSEVFGSPNTLPHNELMPFRPTSPYGISKAACYWLLQSYRSRYGLFFCNGILFNHESPRRPESFVSRKITRGAARIKLGLTDRLTLGDLTACRDWGYAGDFVEAMWRTLQLSEPEDFVIGTGKQYPIVHLLELAFGQLGLNWQEHVRIDATLLRPGEPRYSVADISKAKQLLDWSPRTTVPELVSLMVQADLDSLGQIGHNSAAA